MLLGYIDGKVLGHINLMRQPLEKRRSWAKQVEHTVMILHRHNIIWGDAKASNVLIDRKDERAWLIDFGGSYTEGWIEPELRESKEGDLQGLKKIVDFLEHGASDLVEPFYSDDEMDMEGRERQVDHPGSSQLQRYSR